jgi:hypothetical protein
MLKYFLVIRNILRPLGKFYFHLEKLREFGIFSTVLVNCVKKNLATLHQSTKGVVNECRQPIGPDQGDQIGRFYGVLVYIL